ncbi:MAG: SPFH domain-containing protein [Planctomycetota bacterium]
MLRLISILVIVLTALGIIARLNVVQIEIGQTGVLTREFSDGLVKKDYAPGFHWNMGPLHTWDVFDTTVQTLSMLRSVKDGAFQLKSADGATVTLDVTVKYKIKPGECHKILEEFGRGTNYQEKVRNQAIDAMRPVFGSMETEDFYDPAARAKRASQAEQVLSKRLAGLHVDLIGILVRDVSFEEAYEKRIQEKEIAKQDAQLNDAKKDAAEFVGETNKILAETDAKVTVIEEGLQKSIQELTAENEVQIAKIKADAERYVVEMRAEADLVVAEKTAAGDLLVKNAEAEAQALRQRALVGSGASNLIALEAARNLQLTKFVVSTRENNILNLLDLATKLGASGKSGK